MAKYLPMPIAGLVVLVKMNKMQRNETPLTKKAGEDLREV